LHPTACYSANGSWEKAIAALPAILDGLLLLAWSLIAIAGLACGGRDQLDCAQAPTHRRQPLLRMLAGLAVLTGAGIASADGLRRGGDHHLLLSPATRGVRRIGV